MHVDRAGDGSITITERWVVLRVTCVCAAAALVWLTVFVCDEGAATCSSKSQWGGVLGAAGLLAIAGVVADLRVRFDAGTRLVAWSRRRWIGARSGSVAFSAVRDVRVRAITDRDLESNRPHPEWQLELVTADATLSLSSQRARDPAGYQALAASLRQLVGLVADHPDPRPPAAPERRTGA